MIRILQISDTHLFADDEGVLLGCNTQQSFNDVLALVEEEKLEPDLILLTGDLSQDGSIHSYEKIAMAMEQFNCPIHWIPGNHDVFSTMRNVFAASQLNDEKIIDVDNWCIVLLNSLDLGHVPGLLTPQELDHLRQSLAATNAANKIVCLHHHPIAIGSAWLDNLGLVNHEDFFTIIDDDPQIKLVLHGHIHQEFKGYRKGVCYLSAPSTGIQFAPKKDDFGLDPKPPGFHYLTLNEDGGFESQVFRIASSQSSIDFNAAGY